MHISRRTLAKGAAVAALQVLTFGARIRAGLADDEVEPADIDQLTVIVGGLDSRLPGEPENADVFIIARVDIPSGSVRAVSVPRDLYVEIPGFGYDKITRAYDFGSKADGGSFKGGRTTMIDTVRANFGIETDAVLVTTFPGFESVVDALGGVDVVNPYDLYDGEYPTLDYGYTEIFFPAGPIHLSGAEALQFVRTRHQDGDPGRVMRQQLVLLAMLEAATTADVLPILPELVEDYRQEVKNSLGIRRRLALALAAPQFEPSKVSFADLNGFVYSDYTAQGMWIYAGDWSQIPGYIQTHLAGSV